MNKQILFWCPFLSEVGIINAAIQSAPIQIKKN